jgi:hypothetical protein
MVRSRYIYNFDFKIIEIYEEYKFGKSADDIENIESLENIQIKMNDSNRNSAI